MNNLVKIIAYIYVIISSVLLINVPVHYSKLFCTVEMLLFLVCSIPFVINKAKQIGFFNFYTFFLFSFFCINYLHSVFIYPDDSFLISFSFPYNINNICHGVAMASLFVSFLILGSVSFHNKICHSKGHCPRINLLQKTKKIAFILAAGVLFYVFFILKVSYGLKHLYPRLMLLIATIIVLSVFYQSYYSRKILNNRNNLIQSIMQLRPVLISAFLFTIALLRIGSRTNVLLMWLGIIGVINAYVYRIKFKQIFPLMILGILFMAIITVTRISPVNLTNSDILTVLKIGFQSIVDSPNSIWIVFTDFIVNVRTLYDSFDFVDAKGYLYGESYLQYTLAFIPGGGFLVTTLFLQKIPSMTNTDNYLIEFTNSPYGMGTNVVADTYMNSSVIGVIIFAFLLGLLVNYCSNCKSKYATFLYIALLSNSIYIARASIFCFLDMFFMLVISDYVLNLCFNKNSVRLKE